MSVLSLADAKAHLNISSTSFDVELQGVIDAAEALVAKRCGPLASTSVSCVARASSDAIVLPVSPAVSLTSVTPLSGAAALNVASLYLDTVSAVVTSPTGAVSFAEDRYTVVYQAGRTSVPNDLLLGVKELVRHLWGSQRGPGARGAAEPQAPGYLIPNRVAELLAPHEQHGFA